MLYKFYCWLSPGRPQHLLSHPRKEYWGGKPCYGRAAAGWSPWCPLNNPAEDYYENIWGWWWSTLAEITLMMLEASSASGSWQYLLVRIITASAHSSWFWGTASSGIPQTPALAHQGWRNTASTSTSSLSSWWDQRRSFLCSHFCDHNLLINYTKLYINCIWDISNNLL